MNRRLKVLVSAYACSPFQGSEPGVGWGFIVALAKHHDLWVFVEEEKFREHIETALAADPELGRSVNFHFVRKKRNRQLRRIWPPSYYWYYRRWHREVYRLARDLHTRIIFDVAHQLTMVGFREPGYLWRLGIPFVWGPIGGMSFFPWRFLAAVGIRGAAYYLAYNIINWCHMRFLRRPRSAARIAGDCLMSATPADQEGAMSYWGSQSTLMTEVGLPCEPARYIQQRSPEQPLRLVWSGLHIPRKALNIALQALSVVPTDVHCELHILGAGPQTRAMKQLSERLGIDPRCHFHGWLARADALAVMRSSHVLLLTSLRDLSSTVVVEALALGLPIVCLDHCGFSAIVDESCGIKIPATRPSQVVAGIAQAIQSLAGNESRRRDMARGALERARAYTWENKGAVVSQIYHRAVERSSSTGEPVAD